MNYSSDTGIVKYVLILAVMLTSIHVLGQASIKVFTEPGVDVYLNKEYMGTSELKLGGLLINDIKAGNYDLSLYKGDSHPQKSKLIVSANELNYFYSLPFAESGNSAYLESAVNPNLGTLTVQSNPVQMYIEIPKLDLSFNKTHTLTTIKGIVPGGYLLRCTCNGKVIEKEIFIAVNNHVNVDINMEADAPSTRISQVD